MTRIIDNAHPALLFRSLRARKHAPDSNNSSDISPVKRILLSPDDSSDDDGFTFVELIVSMLILAVISVIIIPMFINSISTTDNQNRASQASQQLHQITEEIRIDAQSLTPVPTCNTLSRAVDRVNEDNVHTTRTTSGATNQYETEVVLVDCESLSTGQHGLANISLHAYDDDTTLARTAMQIHVQGGSV